MKKDLLASCMATLLGITLCSPCAWAGQTEGAENSTPPPRLSVVGDVNGSEAVQPERGPGAPDEVQAPEEIDDETDRKAAGLAGGDSLPVEAEAKANVSAPQSSAEARSNAASVFDIGDGQPYAGFAEAIAAIPSDAGDVVFNVKSNLYQDYRDYLPGGILFSLPTDRNMTSLTITSDANAQTIVGNGGSDSYCINLFANGVPIIIEAPLKMNALIYGGSNGAPLSGASSITVREGAFARSLFGGSLNADLSGDATILVEGTASTVVGGCRAYASDSGLANASATLRGSSFIDIGEAGGAQKAIGGGIACFPSSGSAALSADAATTGSTNITVNGSIDEVYGGGSAGATSIALSTLSNTAATANVAGSASITFGAKAQTYSSGSMSKMHVYGGGLATGTSKENANRSAADVAGTVTITALEDDTAAQSQPDSKAFSRFYGGGCALYGGAQANVGATVIMTARCGWESAAGIIGGGYALAGGTADVLGATRVEVFGIEGQKANYENANLVAGGGFAENNSNDLATSACADSTEVIIHKGANLTSGSNTGMSVIGGGIAKGNVCTSDVAGTARIEAKPGASVTRGAVGGGIAWGSKSDGRPQGARNASADVGSTSVVFGEGCTSGGLVIGGGYAFSNAVESTANVIGNVSVSTGDGCSFTGNFVIGGGLASLAADCEASVFGNVNTDFGDGTATKSFVGGGFSYNGSTGCATDVQGSVTTNFGDTYTMSAGQFIGGGYVYYNSTDCSAASGSVHTEMGKNATLTGRWVTAAGNVSYNSAGDVHVGSDKGADSVTFTAEEGYAAYVFSNGGYIAGDQTAASTAQVTGSVSSSFENCDIKYFYGGAYLSDTNGNGTIDGNVESRFSKCALPAQDGTMPRAGSGITGDAKLVFADSVLAKGYIGATSASDIGGKHIVSFVGNSTCKDFIYAEHQKGTLLIEIGDEKGTSTQTVVSGVYSPNHIGETDILIHKGATFTPSTISADGSGAPYHLMGVYDLTIEGGGSLVGYNENPTTLYGNLTGVPASDSEATASITMPASATITGDEASGSALEGVLEVHPTGTLTTGMTLFDFARTGNGKVLLDDPSRPQRYYLAKDETSQQNRTLWTIAAGSTITVKQAEHGTIEPGDNAFNRNEPATYTFVPDYGYRLESILIDGMSAGDVAPGSDRAVSYAFTPSTDTCEVSAVFVPLETEDLHDRIENLPEAADVPTASEETRNAILDAKLDLEAHLEQNPDAPVDADALDKLHEDLLRLPEIQVEVVVEVAGEGGSADEIVTIENGCLHHFVYEFGKDEIRALRNGSAELLKIKAVINDDIVDAEGAERAALDAKLGEEYLLGKHFSVTVTKQTFKSRTDDIPLASEQIHSLGKGITMTFAIPDAVASESGDARTFAIARTHQEDDGSWTASLLPDENTADRASVTVTTDRFSRYAIAYSDVAVPPVDPTPPPAPEEGERKEGGGEDSRAKAKALAKVGDPLPSPVAGTAALAFIACGFALLLRKQAR